MVPWQVVRVMADRHDVPTAEGTDPHMASVLSGVATILNATLLWPRHIFLQQTLFCGVVHSTLPHLASTCEFAGSNDVVHGLSCLEDANIVTLGLGHF